jgi:hypothetical protein
MRFKREAAARIAMTSCLALAGCLGPASVRAQRDLGFGFCPPPVVPKCVSKSATYVEQGEIDACQEDVNRYVNSVGKYRLCLTQEVERAVRETNGTLQRWKCSVAGKALCP